VTEKAETRLSKRFAKELERLQLGGLLLEFDKIAQRSKRGFPDYLICARGKLLLVELKMPGEDPDPLQSWKLARYARCGAETFVVYPHSLPDFIHSLEKLFSSPECTCPASERSHRLVLKESAEPRKRARPSRSARSRE
jgi:hypothetical protein